MNKYQCFFIYCFVFVCSIGHVRGLDSNDSTGLPGDNFSLEGALELFKKSTSPEEFEVLLNAETSRVNNLDLNEDGETDYVKVIDKNEGNVHTFILQAAVSETENQDIAVIELEKSADGNAIVQIVGDEDIYGVETIMEPVEEVKTNAGVSANESTVNVWMWPTVQYVYGPTYSLWVSPMKWRTRPVWWKPWKPVSYVVFYPYRHPYRRNYRIAHSHSIVPAPKIYRPVRTTSVMVATRNRAAIAHYRSNHRRNTVQRRSRNATHQSTTITGRRGNSATRKSTAKTRPRSNTVTKKTTKVTRGKR